MNYQAFLGYFSPIDGNVNSIGNGIQLLFKLTFALTINSL